MYTRLTVIILFSVAVLLSGTVFSQGADAIKGSGQKNLETNSNQVCGDKLCEKPMSIKEKIDEYKSTFEGPSIAQQAAKVGIVPKIKEQTKQTEPIEKKETKTTPQEVQPSQEEKTTSQAEIEKIAIVDLKRVGGNKIPNQYIIVPKNATDVRLTVLSDQIKSKGGQVLNTYNLAIKGLVFKLDDKQILDKLKQDPSILYVEQDVEVVAFESELPRNLTISILVSTTQTIPTGINRIDSDLSSTNSGNHRGNVDVDIAIIDTGIDVSHPDLNVYKQKNFLDSGSESGSDDNGHGTHVAGIAAAKDNEIGVVGVAPGARLWALKVLNSVGSGSMSGVIAAIDYVTQNAAEIEVANLSLGCECNSLILDMAIYNSVDSGVTYVVAAGNNAKNATTFSPANNPRVITVSAIADSDGQCGGIGPTTNYGADDTFASFSNFGSVVNMAAPGVNINSTTKGSSYIVLSGTSMASPHVAGAAALYKSTHTMATPQDVLDALMLEGSMTTTLCDQNGHGYFSGDKDNLAEPLLYVRNN